MWFQGLLLFGVVAVLIVVVFFVVVRRRHEYEEADPENPGLSDEEFRRIEYGDDV